EAHPVGLLEKIAIDQQLRLAATGRNAIHALEAELARPLHPIDRHAPVPGIGKIDRAVGTNADIVGAVELLAFEMRRDDLALPIALADEARCGMLAHDQRKV